MPRQPDRQPSWAGNDPILARMLVDMQWDIRATSGRLDTFLVEFTEFRERMRRWAILGGIWAANIMGYLSKDQASDLIVGVLTSLIK
jgi:hypothetical protein